jgi:hypothetical protein
VPIGGGSGRTVMTSMVSVVDGWLALGLAVGRARWILLHGLAIPRRQGAACVLLLHSQRASGAARVERQGRCRAARSCRAIGVVAGSVCTVSCRTGAAADTGRAGRGRADCANKQRDGQRADAACATVVSDNSWCC